MQTDGITQTKFLLAGHSHCYALGLPSRPHDDPNAIVGLFADADGVVGGWPRDNSYWDYVVEQSAGYATVVIWEGSQHIARFLLVSQPDFDFVWTDFPTRADVPLVPRSLVGSYLSQQTYGLADTVKRLAAVPGCRPIVAGTPPPKNDDRRLHDLLRTEDYYVSACKRLGYSVDELEKVRFSDPQLRLKSWAVVQSLLKAAADAYGAVFVPVPDEVKDDDGFLAHRFWNPDLTHANGEYGSVMWQHIRASVRAA